MLKGVKEIVELFLRPSLDPRAEPQDEGTNNVLKYLHQCDKPFKKESSNQF
jgi:hypothetical protein